MRINNLAIEDVAWYLRPLFWLQRRRWGQILAPALAWARSPRHYLALLAFYSAIERRGSPLQPALRSLLQVRVSQLTHCAFCMDLNAALAAQRAGSMEKALAVAQWRESPLFSEREKAALEYAEAMTAGAPGEELSARVKALFGEAALLEMSALVAFQNMSARFNAALDLPAQGFCRIGSPPG